MSGPQAIGPPMSDRAVENAKRREATMQQIVSLYLKEKKHDEEKVKGDLQAYASLVLNDFDQFCSHQTVTITHSLGENKPEQYEASYVKLKEWIHQSLDLYKPELLGFLYPIFMSIFITLVQKEYVEEARSFLEKHRADHEPGYTEEIDRVKGISTAQHIIENAISAMFFRDKYILKVSREAVDLLIYFILESDLMLILRIMNKTIQLETLKVKDEANAFVRKSGFVSAAKGHIVRWPKTPEDIVSSKYELVPDSVGVMQPQKKQRTNAEPTEPSIPLPKLDDTLELSIFRDLARRVEVSSRAKPSVCFHTFVNTRSSLNTMAINGDGSMVVGGFQDAALKLWDLAAVNDTDSVGTETHRARVRDSAPTSVLTGHGGPIFGAAFSPDNRFLISSSEDATVRLWSLETHSNLVAFKGHSYPVWSVAFSPFGMYFASASHDRTARLWSTDHISYLRMFVGHYSDVDCVCFHPNSNYIATGSTDQTLRLWDIQSGQCVRVFSGNTGGVNACEISPCGKYLASGTDKGQVTLWDLGSCRIVSVLGQHASNSPVFSLSFSNGKGNILASGGADNTVRLWDVASAQSPQESAQATSDFGCGVFRTKETRVGSLRFTRANLLVAAGSYAHPEGSSISIKNSK